MAILRLILGDQLSENISSLKGANKDEDLILMCEVKNEATYVKHHKKKIAFIFSCMRHFAAKLLQDGFKVIYTKYEDEENSGSFLGKVKKIISQNKIDKITLTFPGEYRLLEEFKKWPKILNLPVEILDDDRFLCSLAQFTNFAKNYKTPLMENFYRKMRLKHKILLDENNKPLGGKWNFDASNRQKPDPKIKIPKTYHSKIDNIDQEVLQLVEENFSDHFGDLEPFFFATTRKEALAALDLFIEERLINFGSYQDAMLEEAPLMFHSHISFYLNVGLLEPLEVIKKAEKSYHENKAPLNSVEGFIRQILGWREYVRGIYWLKMPKYGDENFLESKNKLPDFFWSGETKMNCLKNCIKNTKENAYAHHIQRLMVLGNFALIAGLDVKEVNEWYLIVYADAFEWVEMPNVSGMILFADGGFLGTKPYAASGSYINKMSNYCKNCSYNVKEKNGSNACPFNYLYWNFFIKNKAKLQNNHRLKIPYASLNKFSSEKIAQILADSQHFLANI